MAWFRKDKSDVREVLDEHAELIKKETFKAFISNTKNVENIKTEDERDFLLAYLSGIIMGYSLIVLGSAKVMSPDDFLSRRVSEDAKLNVIMGVRKIQSMIAHISETRHVLKKQLPNFYVHGSELWLETNELFDRMQVFFSLSDEHAERYGRRYFVAGIEDVLVGYPVVNNGNLGMRFEYFWKKEFN